MRNSEIIQVIYLLDQARSAIDQCILTNSVDKTAKLHQQIQNNRLDFNQKINQCLQAQVISDETKTQLLKISHLFNTNTVQDTKNLNQIKNLISQLITKIKPYRSSLDNLNNQPISKRSGTSIKVLKLALFVVALIVAASVFSRTYQKLPNQNKQIIGKNTLVALVPLQQPETQFEQVFNFTNNNIELSIRAKYSQVRLSHDEDVIIPAIVSLHSKERQQYNEQQQKVTSNQQNRAAIDLVCVIDRSGSMGGNKIDLVRDTLLQLLELLDERDRLSIVLFDYYAQILIPLEHATSEHKAKLFIPKIRQISSQGGTSIRNGIQMGLDILKDRNYKNSVSSLFLLSDGLDSYNWNSVTELIDQYSSMPPYTIQTFGFGNDHDPKLMSDISKAKDGSFFFIEKLQDIGEAFVIALGGLQSVEFQDVTLQIEVPQNEYGVQISKTFGDMWIRKGSMSESKYEINIVQLLAGSSKDFVVELLVPKIALQNNEAALLENQRTQVVLKVQFQGLNLESQEIVYKQADLPLTFFNSYENLTPEEDGLVTENHFRVKSAQVMHECLDLAQQGRQEEAQTLIHNIIQEIESSSKVNRQSVEPLIEDLILTTQHVKPEVFESKGKHYITNHKRVHMEQRAGHPDHNGLYLNKAQGVRVSEYRTRQQQQ